MQQTQPLDPREFIRLARELGARTDEASLRAAVGRAYYGLFLLAREKLGLSTTSKDVHGEVTMKLRALHGYWKAADHLKILRQLRNVADYQPMPDKAKDRDWVQNWATAERIVTLVLPQMDAIT